jgi:hypothetical protein
VVEVTIASRVLVSLLAVQPGDGEPARGGGSSIEWSTDLRAAQAAAGRADRPLFVVFRCER